jgi:Domain of unknown function (DUF4167)
MNTSFEVKPAAAQPRPKAKNMTHAMPRKSRFQGTEPGGVRRPDAKPAQNAQRNYQRYLELARAETLHGDRIAAENYLQHAEHYLRTMGEDSH